MGVALCPREPLKHLTLMWKSTCHIQTYPQRRPSARRSFQPSWPHPFPHRRPASSRWCQSYLQTQKRNHRRYPERLSTLTRGHAWGWNLSLGDLAAYLTGQQTWVLCIRVRADCSWHLLHAVATVCTCLFFLCKRRAWGGSFHTAEEIAPFTHICISKGPSFVDRWHCTQHPFTAAFWFWQNPAQKRQQDMKDLLWGPSCLIVNSCNWTAGAQTALFISQCVHNHSSLNGKQNYLTGAHPVHHIQAPSSVCRWQHFKHHCFPTSSKQLTRTSLQPSSREASWTFPGCSKFNVIANNTQQDQAYSASHAFFDIKMFWNCRHLQLLVSRLAAFPTLHNS